MTPLDAPEGESAVVGGPSTESVAGGAGTATARDPDLSVPVYPGALPVKDPVETRESDTSVARSYVFWTPDPHASVAGWYEEELGDEWTEPDIETALGGSPLATFRRSGPGDSSANVTVTGGEGKTRISHQEPHAGGARGAHALACLSRAGREPGAVLGRHQQAVAASRVAAQGCLHVVGGGVHDEDDVERD